LADEKAALMAAWKAEKMDAAKAAVLADVTVRLMAVQWAARRANIMVASMAVTRAAKCSQKSINFYYGCKKKS
jgi:hypothetical protein